MTPQDPQGPPADVTRRDFLHSAAAAGAGLVLAHSALGQEAGPKPDDLKIGIIGVGSQGRYLLINCLKIPGIRFVAVCDIWNYHQRYGAGILRKYKMPVNVYTEYEQMLAKEKDMDAVIVATPDWLHAPITLACLKAGLHVYCEKEMANTIDSSREIVLAARQSGKLVQIGHQRRSNPRYWHAMKMIYKDKVLGRVTHAQGQWHRARREPLGWPKKYTMDKAFLARFGYESMEQFRNWRWYRRFSGGPIADLGSHQIDIFNWFLGAPPQSVIASGGLDYYKGREWYDNVFAVYEYQTAWGAVRAQYDVLNSTSHGGYYETFMGDEGSLVISEDARKGFILREVHAKRREWEDEAEKIETMGQKAIQLKVGQTLRPDGTKDPKAEKLAAQAKKPPHQLHLENFFDAIRGKAKLTCPPQAAFETAVAVLKVNDAVQAHKQLTFDPSEFKV